MKEEYIEDILKNNEPEIEEPVYTPEDDVISEEDIIVPEEEHIFSMPEPESVDPNMYNGYISKGSTILLYNGLRNDIPEGYQETTIEIWQSEQPVRPRPDQATVKRIQNINIEMNSIITWFTSHDYYINKIFLGEWEESDPRYQQYLLDRVIHRNNYDALKEELELLKTQQGGQE